MSGNPYYQPYWAENELEHYGVKGMRWGVRKKEDDNSSIPSRATKVSQVSERSAMQRTARKAAEAKEFEKIVTAARRNTSNVVGGKHAVFRVNADGKGYDVRPHGDEYWDNSRDGHTISAQNMADIYKYGSPGSPGTHDDYEAIGEVIALRNQFQAQAAARVGDQAINDIWKRGSNTPVSQTYKLPLQKQLKNAAATLKTKISSLFAKKPAVKKSSAVSKSSSKLPAKTNRKK